MNISKIYVQRAAIAAALTILVPAASAFAALTPNGITVVPRVTNTNPGSVLTITNSNSNPGNVTIDDRGFAAAGVNRHDALASLDGGATAYNFVAADSFTISGTFMLTAGSNTPRKQVGLHAIGPAADRPRFMINSDAGEIAAFGGGLPFKSFSSGAQADYVPGTSITLGEIYRPNGGGANGTIEYFIDRTPADGLLTGFETSGPLLINNGAQLANFKLGIYTEFNTNLTVAATDFGNAVITNLTVTTPEPATLASLAIGGLMLRRRRA